ncbi:MAG: serine hydrolase [bacterium]|nr:serine hydrolase [bacterium]
MKLYMVLSTSLFFLSIPMIGLTQPVTQPRLPIVKPETVGMISSRLKNLDTVIEQAIAEKNTAGAVILVGHRGKIVYRKAYGYRMLVPKKVPMTIDTMFDLASVTKPTAAGTSIMLLVEEGKLRMYDRVSMFVPEFGQKGKEKVTILHLITHCSGLPAWDKYFLKDGIDKQGVILDICSKSTAYEPGTKFVYSDLGYIMLGEIVERVSGMPLDQFAKKRIFEPLGMNDTMYNPPDALKPRCAATEVQNGVPLQGRVHDGNAYVMGGVSGHAGLFSTVDDLAVYCQMLLNGGSFGKVRILGPLTVKAITSNQSPVPDVQRGYGWDIGSSYSTLRGDIFPKGSLGHTGWTGTSIWIDLNSKTFVILLCNRNHPTEDGDVTRLRTLVSNIVAGSIVE